MTTDTLTLEDAIERLDILATACAQLTKRLERVERSCLANHLGLFGATIDLGPGILLPDVVDDDREPVVSTDIRMMRAQVSRDLVRTVRDHHQPREEA